MEQFVTTQTGKSIISAFRSVLLFVLVNELRHCSFVLVPRLFLPKPFDRPGVPYNIGGKKERY